MTPQEQWLSGPSDRDTDGMKPDIDLMLVSRVIDMRAQAEYAIEALDQIDLAGASEVLSNSAYGRLYDAVERLRKVLGEVVSE